MLWVRVMLCAVLLMGASPGWAQTQVAADGAPAQAPPPDDPDLDLDVVQPDFALVGLPTTLRVPRFKSAFRITHRFLRPLAQGTFANLAEDAFGLDAGAQIGLEYRFGLMRGMQVGFHRTSDRTIQWFAAYNLAQERSGRPVGINAYASIEGTNNFRDRYASALGVVFSRSVRSLATVYVEPIWVSASNPLGSAPDDRNDSFLMGVGTRVRLRPTVYGVVEFGPRVAGYAPGVHQLSFGFEKRAGGHSFQLNVSNAFGTTPGQIAQGGGSNDDWYLGFNISRKFF